ncbi:hypothetical protein SAMN05192588_0699 [Nonlabens sp. Hel1_33_55]|uniref:hypothetical protein n=1 Tax=Nonlabens sp. Hel1_33_55 TaxID=1336802 RepID=UPI000875C10F|nr:hypothetical protein [Nonlabens sp. Hel1_33_55]SCY00693.1 hypothetical protein SAMN05192588_0699 [Nonlabens sp. Hel1_33_55]
MHKDFKINRTTKKVLKGIVQGNQNNFPDKLTYDLYHLSEYQFLWVFKNVIRTLEVSIENIELFANISIEYESFNESFDEVWVVNDLKNGFPFPTKRIFDPIDKLDYVLDYFYDWDKLDQTKREIIDTVKHEITLYETDIKSLLRDNNICKTIFSVKLVQILNSVVQYLERDLSSNYPYNRYFQVKNEIIENFRQFNLDKSVNFSNLKFERCFIYCLTHREWIERYHGYFQKAEIKNDLINRKNELINLLRLDNLSRQPVFERFKVSYNSCDYLTDEPWITGSTAFDKRMFNLHHLPVIDPDAENQKDSRLYQEEIDDLEVSDRYILSQNLIYFEWIDNYKLSCRNPIFGKNFKPLILKSGFNHKDFITILNNILISYSGISIKKNLKKEMALRINLLVNTFSVEEQTSDSSIDPLLNYSLEKPLINFPRNVKDKLQKALFTIVLKNKIVFDNQEEVFKTLALMFLYDFKIGFSASTLKSNYLKFKRHLPTDITNATLDPHSEQILSCSKY